MDELVNVAVQVNKTEMIRLCRERIDIALKEAENEYVFWDSAELRKRTCLSWTTIQGTFFFDSRFPKFKIGSKWYFPVKEVREFLERWIREQPTS